MTIINNSNYLTATDEEWATATDITLIGLPDFNREINSPNASVLVQDCKSCNQPTTGDEVLVSGCPLYDQPTTGDVVRVLRCESYNQPTTGDSVWVQDCKSYNQLTTGREVRVVDCPLYDDKNTIITGG